jgi:competence protein ComEC
VLTAIALVGAVAASQGALGQRVATVLLAGLYGSIAAQQVYHPRFPPDHVALLSMGVPLEIEAIAVDDAGAGQRTRLLLQVCGVDDGGGWHSAEGRLRLSLRKAERRWLAGDRMRLRTVLRRPRNFGNPGELDYAGYLARHGIYVTAYADDDRSFSIVERAAAGPLQALLQWRRDIGAGFDASLPAADAAVLRALIIGDDAGIPQTLRRAFSRTGVTHVLSISGLHVGLVATAGFAAFRWLLARSHWLLLAWNVPKLAVALSVVPVLLYAGIAGSNVATLRSVIMVVVFIGAVLVDRQRHLLVSLAAAAILTVVNAPGASLDISFQLSFAAVLGLTLAMQRFWPWWRQREEAWLLRLRHGWYVRLYRPIALYVVVSVSALAATTPLTALHFNQISLLALIANAIAVPLLGSLAVVLGLLAALCTPLAAPLAHALTLAAGLAVHLGCWFVELFARLPGAALRVVTPTAWELTLAYSALLLGVLSSGRRRWVLWAVVAVLAFGDAVWWWRERYAHSDLRVTFLSVGQGDAVVLELPGGSVMLVDGGGIGDGSFDTGERLIAPFLWSRKIGHVDYVVLSHPQWDHFGGLRYIVEQFAPRQLWWNGTQASGKRFAELQKAVDDTGVERVVVRQGAARRIGDVAVAVLAPPAGALSWGVNDLSVVLQLSYGTTRVLFTGDIEAASETRLLASAGDQVRSTVLKVPHHGSRTSSTAAFVATVAPSLAVISAGFDNRFGFPHAEVLRRYAALPAAVLRTDVDGAIQLRISADGPLKVNSYLGSPTASTN